MLPFIHPSSYFSTCPIIIIDSPTYLDDGNDEEDLQNSSSTILSQTSPVTTTLPLNTTDNSSLPIINDHRPIFRLRIHVDGFQPDDLNINIQRGRLIVRGRHKVRELHSYSTLLPSTNDNDNDNDDDNEPDFVCKEFKRTFSIPTNTDTQNARAHFFARQQILLVEIPFDNLSIVRSPLRPLDIFFTIVTILFIDRSLRLTYEQFSLHDPQFSRLPDEQQTEDSENA